MGQPFIGSEALAAGTVSRHELRRFHTAVLPNVYQEKRAEPTLLNRTQAAWLWSQRQAVVSGLSASALHGAKWIDDDATVELIWRNARAPHGVKTRADLILDGESQYLAGVVATTPERTAFDLGRRGPLRQAVARLDALANATHFKIDDVAQLASRHRHTRGLRQLEAALYLVDAGAQSPKETWLRLLLSDAGFPGRRPRSRSSAKTAIRNTSSTWVGRTSCWRSNTTAITSDRSAAVRQRCGAAGVHPDRGLDPHPGACRTPGL